MNETKLDVGLLLLGLLLVGLSVSLNHYLPSTQLTPRVLTALGGGFIGTAIPGVLKIRVKGVRAVGGLALVVLFFLWGGAEEPKMAEPKAENPASEKARAGANRDRSPECVGDNCTQIITY